MLKNTIWKTVLELHTLCFPHHDQLWDFFSFSPMSYYFIASTQDSWAALRADFMQTKENLVSPPEWSDFVDLKLFSFLLPLPMFNSDICKIFHRLKRVKVWDYCLKVVQWQGTIKIRVQKQTLLAGFRNHLSFTWEMSHCQIKNLRIVFLINWLKCLTCS